MNIKKSSRAGLALAAMLFFPLLGHSGQEPAISTSSDATTSIEDSMPVEYPKTFAEHEAAAKLYREKAAKYRKLADRHRKMKAFYAEDKNHVLPQMDKHCDKVIKKYLELADEFDQFAIWHEKQAKAGSK